MTEPKPTPQNVHQRKLMVVKRLMELKPDKTHAESKFEYHSIQAVSGAVAGACVEFGLGFEVSIPTPDTLTITLTNVDDPADQIVSHWPIIDGDKGFAYSIKFPLIRMFLIADGEEEDEAEMAKKPRKSSATAPRYNEAAPSPRRANPPDDGVIADMASLYAMGRDVSPPQTPGDIDNLVKSHGYPAIRARLTEALGKLAVERERRPEAMIDVDPSDVPDFTDPADMAGAVSAPPPWGSQ